MEVDGAAALAGATSVNSHSMQFQSCRFRSPSSIAAIDTAAIRRCADLDQVDIR